MHKAIVFDLDDTLYPERQYVFSGFAAVAAAFEDRLGDRGTTLADMKRMFDSPHRPRVFNALLVERGLVDDARLISEMIECYGSQPPAIELYADAEAALSSLRASFKLGLISDGRPRQQWAKIDALGLRARLKEIIITSDLGEESGKPHPRAFMEMARRLGVEHAACVYVADNPAKDFIAPNALGWLTIQVTRADALYRDVAAPPGGAPHKVIESLNRLHAILQQAGDK